MGKTLDYIYKLKESNRKGLAVLIDPDNLSTVLLKTQVELAVTNKVDFFFIGGSMITNDCLDETLEFIKSKCDIPTILFPGSIYQVSKKADAVLFLSLTSGRNAELLIGKQVEAAPLVKASGIEVIPTGYLLIDSGVQTTASYMSNSTPIPHNKPNIAAVTAMAGEMLGLKLNFLDGGSGAQTPVTAEMIKATFNATDAPIIIGGGINSEEKAASAWNAGATVIVVGNAFEQNTNLIEAISKIKNAE
jgi:phosphoglycerol geranylgeranyltransferase